MSKEDEAAWSAANQRLQQVTPDDEAARAEGVALHDRALAMTPEEWRQFQERFKGMSARARLFCFAGATFRRADESPESRRASIAVHKHLSNLVLATFGIRPGEDGVGQVPKVPEGL